MKWITTAFLMLCLACGAGETFPDTGSVPFYEPALRGTMWDFSFGPDVIVAYPLNPDGWQMLYIIEYPSVCGDAGV